MSARVGKFFLSKTKLILAGQKTALTLKPGGNSGTEL